jgi:amino acid adenylation domain-containing protein
MVSVAGCAAIVGEEASVETFRQLQAELGVGWQNVSTASGYLMLHHSEYDTEHHGRGVANSSFCYILFTSGSTGQPKGIGITPANLSAYLDHATRAFGVHPGDRASQMFELTFDLSVHDMFVTWLGGGLLCVPPAGTTLAPARFIIDEGITHWFSVPSTAAMLSKFRMLREGVFPSLKQSLFCGEALPASIAAQWHKAAPNSSLWNLYGPTEATIAITAYRWTPDQMDNPQRDVVPIGCPFSGHRVRIVADGVDVERCKAGELCLGGPQVALGYLSDPIKTAGAFVVLEPSSEAMVWYRTGDLVRQDDHGIIHYLGRLDSQIQLHGHRVELGEVEGALRIASSGRTCAVITWPPQQATVESLIAFVEGIGSTDDATALRQSCADLIPDYMVPSRIIYVATMPLNPNGKIDRKSLPSFIS